MLVLFFHWLHGITGSQFDDTVNLQKCILIRSIKMYLVNWGFFICCFVIVPSNIISFVISFDVKLCSFDSNCCYAIFLWILQLHFDTIFNHDQFEQQITFRKPFSIYILFCFLHKICFCQNWMLLLAQDRFIFICFLFIKSEHAPFSVSFVCNWIFKDCVFVILLRVLSEVLLKIRNFLIKC